MTESERKSLEKQLESTKHRLYILEEQHAVFGNLYVPVHIVIEIEDARLDITTLEERLNLERSYGPRPPGTLPPGWNIPHYRNLNFSGRDTELATLKTALVSSNIAAVTQAIAGLGGVGKTQLAVEYVYREAANFALVWWVRAELETSLRRDLEQLALKLGLVEQQSDPQLAIDAALDFLQSKAGRWLLIFDNANNPTEVQGYLPKGGRGQILITSRWQDWRGYAQPQPVQVWEKDQAVEFLLKRTGRNDAEGAAQLADRLGYLPLALEHAGAYLSQNQILTFADYLVEFEQQKLALLEEGELATEYHKRTIRTTWQISLKQLPPEAADLLNLCAYLAPDNIPLSLFLNNNKELPETIAKAAASKISFAKTIATLQQYSLVEIGKLEKSISVHRILQMAIREKNQDSEISSQHFWLSTTVRLINAASPTEIYEYNTWAEYASILPHALFIAEQAEPLELEPRYLARLLNQTGVYHLGRADYATALRLFQRTIAIDEKVYGADHPEVATTYNNLGSLLIDMGDLPNARVFIEKAIAINEIYGTDHLDVARDYSNMGQVLKDLGDHPNSRIYHEKALAIFEKRHGENHPDVATTYNNLGLLFQTMGDLPNSKIYYEKALAIGEKTLGPDHPDVAQSYNNLGALYFALKDFIRAKNYFERSLEIRLEKLGEEHPNTKNTQEWLEDVEEKMKGSN